MVSKVSSTGEQKMSEDLVVSKGGLLLGVIASFPDGTKLERVCDCRGCRAKERSQRYKLLPCGCHGLIVGCNCKVHERACQTCGRVFVASAPYTVNGKRFVDVYEIEDPHGENAKL